jgi:hypothetical protein
MSLYSTVIAQIFTAQACRVRVVTYISPQVYPGAPPAPSMTAIGTFYTLRRSFHTRPPAEAWAAYLHSTYTRGPARNPLINAGFYTDGQLLLFDLD